MAKVYQKRASAAVKKKRAEEKRRQQNKAFLEKHKWHLAIAAGAVVLVIIAAIIISNITYYAGSLPVKNGVLETAQENWIVSNGGTSERPRYFKLGEMATPEGYKATGAERLASLTLEQSTGFEPVDEASPITSIYASPTAYNSADEIASLFASVYGAEKETVTLNGYTFHTVITALENTQNSTETDENGYPIPTGYLGALYAFVEASHDGVIMLQVLADEVESREAAIVKGDLMAALEAGANALTVEKE